MVRWRQIGIREEYYEILVQRAKKNRRSVAGELEWILIEKGVVKPLQGVPTN